MVASGLSAHAAWAGGTRREGGYVRWAPSEPGRAPGPAARDPWRCWSSAHGRPAEAGLTRVDACVDGRPATCVVRRAARLEGRQRVVGQRRAGIGVDGGQDALAVMRVRARGLERGLLQRCCGLSRLW